VKKTFIFPKNDSLFQKDSPFLRRKSFVFRYLLADCED
jgi:hypothetical protein